MATQSLNRQVGGDHYKDMKIQVVEFCYANNIPFIEGAIIKYVCRWKKKNGVADLEKAKHFLDILIELNEKEKTTLRSVFKNNGLSKTRKPMERR